MPGASSLASAAHSRIVPLSRVIPGSKPGDLHDGARRSAALVP
jgi:hypothetical protein